jgi:hypothetical protein
MGCKHIKAELDKQKKEIKQPIKDFFVQFEKLDHKVSEIEKPLSYFSELKLKKMVKTKSTNIKKLLRGKIGNKTFGELEILSKETDKITENLMLSLVRLVKTYTKLEAAQHKKMKKKIVKAKSLKNQAAIKEYEKICEELEETQAELRFFEKMFDEIQVRLKNVENKNLEFNDHKSRKKARRLRNLILHTISKIPPRIINAEQKDKTAMPKSSMYKYGNKIAEKTIGVSIETGEKIAGSVTSAAFSILVLNIIGSVGIKVAVSSVLKRSISLVLASFSVILITAAFVYVVGCVIVHFSPESKKEREKIAKKAILDQTSNFAPASYTLAKNKNNLMKSAII